jgi:hypothetical protein
MPVLEASAERSDRHRSEREWKKRRRKVAVESKMDDECPSKALERRQG